MAAHVHTIKVTVEKHGFSPTMKKVPYEYDEASKPRIADVIIAIRGYLQEELPTLTAYYHVPTGTIATVAEDEYYDPQDNVFFISKEIVQHNTEPLSQKQILKKKKVQKRKIQQRHTSSGSDDEDTDSDNVENQVYNFKVNNTTFVLYSRSTFSKWNVSNATTLKLIYNMAKPDNDLVVGNINLYDFYDSPKLRGVAVIMKYHKASPNLNVFTEAEDKLKRSIVKLAHGAFEDNKYTEHAKTVTDTVFEWLNHNTILEWGANGSNGKISHALRSKAHRERQYMKNSKRLKKSTHGPSENLNSEAFDALVEAINSIQEENYESIKALYDTFPSHRQKWIEKNQSDVSNYVELMEIVFEKFPFLANNMNLLDNDYEHIMEKHYGKSPDFGATIQKYSAAIIDLAHQQKINISDENDTHMVSSKAIFPLLNKFCKPKKFCQSNNFIIIDTERESIETLVKKNNKITENPAVICDSESTVYFTIGQDYYEAPNNSFTEALQTVMQLYYIFNIECDEEVSLFFEFMETMESINKNPKSGLINMKSSLQYIFENISQEEEYNDN